MIELTILGVAFSLLLFYGVPVSFCIGIFLAGKGRVFKVPAIGFLRG